MKIVFLKFIGGIFVVWITGDMHGDIERFKDKNIKKLKKGDYLIVLGDFGFVWDNSESEINWRKKISKQKFTTLFIEGINENFELLKSYPEEDFAGGKARRITDKILFLKSGEVFTLENKKFFCFGGGDYTESEDKGRFEPDENSFTKASENLGANNFEVHYILTHDAPSSIKQFLGMDDFSLGHIGDFLDGVMKNSSYDKWFFAKYHSDKSISFKMQSVYKNLISLYDTATIKSKKRKKDN
jgi:hypothetical protein